MRLRPRMIIIALAAAAGALLVVLFVAGPRLRGQALENARATLFAEARLMARLVRPALATGVSSDALDRLVAAAAGDVRARVTIIGPEGRVLADAELSGNALAAVENHADRPEILEARANGVGSSLRRSATVQRDLLYGAVKIEDDGRLLGFSRVAYNLSELEEQASQLQRAVAFALLVAFGITALLATLLVPPGMGSMKTIMEAARLAVVDNGPGIEAEHLPRLFERFYRVDKARSRELGGTGLGLSIARHLAEGMQAALTVTSEPGQGTRFVLDVPARPQDPPA